MPPTSQWTLVPSQQHLQMTGFETDCLTTVVTSLWLQSSDSMPREQVKLFSGLQYMLLLLHYRKTAYMQPGPKWWTDQLTDQHCSPCSHATSMNKNIIWANCCEIPQETEELALEQTPVCSDRPSHRPPVVSQQTCCLIEMTRPHQTCPHTKRSLGCWQWWPFIKWAWVLQSTQHSPPTGPQASTRCYGGKNTNWKMPIKRAIIRSLSRKIRWKCTWLILIKDSYDEGERRGKGGYRENLSYR